MDRKLKEEARLQNNLFNRAASLIINRFLEGKLNYWLHLKSIYRFLESFDLPIKFNEVTLSPDEFKSLVNGNITNQIYKNLVDGILDCKWAKNIFYHMPSDQWLVDKGSGSFFICEEHITIEHDCKKKQWCITSWGEWRENVIFNLKHIFRYRMQCCDIQSSQINQ